MKTIDQLVTHLWSQMMNIFQEFPLIELDSEEMYFNGILDLTENKGNPQNVFTERGMTGEDTDVNGIPSLKQR